MHFSCHFLGTIFIYFKHCSFFSTTDSHYLAYRFHLFCKLNSFYLEIFHFFWRFFTFFSIQISIILEIIAHYFWGSFSFILCFVPYFWWPKPIFLILISFNFHTKLLLFGDHSFILKTLHIFLETISIFLETVFQIFGDRFHLI